ncbi:MAG: hypothetical protein M3461_11770 [Pseudomonadota bacterium]|nr:hypothetical protein [Pseudomonadota bacterium]
MDLSTITTIVVTVFSVGAAWGSLKRSVAAVEKTIDERITPGLRDVSERLARIEERVTTLWERRLARAASPKKLTAYGERLLRRSSFAALLQKHERALREEVLWKEPKTPHEADVAITRALRSFLAHRPDISNTLEERAYRCGATLDDIIFVGSLYLRDHLFPKLRFHSQEPRTAKSRRRTTARNHQYTYVYLEEQK